MRPAPARKPAESGEFLWLMSLSDLMILLFILFVVLFSFSYKKMKQSDFENMASTIKNGRPPLNPIDEIRTNFESLVKQQKLEQQITISKTDDALKVEIKDQALFSSGDFSVRLQGISVLRQLAAVLERIPKAYRVGIEGHTDDSPIHTDLIMDNWDLAAKRSLAVLHTLALSPQLASRTVMMAYGDTQPLVPNRDAKGNIIAENQSKNRRVTLRIF